MMKRANVVRPPRFDFNRRRTAGESRCCNAPKSPPSQLAIELADRVSIIIIIQLLQVTSHYSTQFKDQIEGHAKVIFLKYMVIGSNSSLPTPNSGATTGTDHFIEVR